MSAVFVWTTTVDIVTFDEKKEGALMPQKTYSRRVAARALYMARSRI